MMNTNNIKTLLKVSALGALCLEPVVASDLAARERIRRETLILEAEKHLFAGREAYAKGNYEVAVQEFRTALDKTPSGSVAQERRDVINEHIVDGSVALAQQYASVGKFDEAKGLLNNVIELDEDNKDAKKALEKIEDPYRTNPALTFQHTQNVDKVVKLLHLGEGYYNLGDFDKAEVEFTNILKVDPYNKAARRWLERISNVKSDYYRAAYDERRAAMLAQVDKAWEQEVAPDVLSLNEINQQSNSQQTKQVLISNKLKNIIIPAVDFEDTPLSEAVEFMRMRSRELDNTEIDPAKKGINFIIRGGKKKESADAGMSVGFGATDPNEAVISELRLTNIPLIQLLQFVCEQAGLRYRVGEYAITLLPLGDDEGGQDIISRSWSVTPTFKADLGGAGGGGSSASSDPFAPVEEESTSFVDKPVQQLLEEAGVNFTEGTSASFLPATSTLIVRNTINNLDLVDGIVEKLATRTPKQIKILTKFVEVSQTNMDELGFDWNLGLGGTDLNVRGGAVGNGQDTTGDFYTGTDVGRIVSSGLRSGDGAITSDSIASLIESGISSGGTSDAAAPGILSVGGIYNGTTIEMIMRGLSQKKGVDVMSAPSIIARSGETAKIEVIREFIYPEEYEPPEVPDQVAAQGIFPVTPATPTAFATRNTGVTLEILPQTGDTNDYVINLQFAPEVVEFEGFINYGSPIQGSATDIDTGETTQITITDNRIEMPIFSTRRVQTALTIFDGHTIAVGGLMREDVQHVEDKIPIVGDIPLIGRLFQSKAESRIKSNLMLFVTAQVVDATGKPIRGAANSTDNGLDELLSAGVLPGVQ